MGIVYDTVGQTEEKEPEQTKVMCEEGEKCITVKKRRVRKKNNKQTPHLQKKIVTTVALKRGFSEKQWDLQKLLKMCWKIPV